MSAMRMEPLREGSACSDVVRGLGTELVSQAKGSSPFSGSTQSPQRSYGDRGRGRRFYHSNPGNEAVADRSTRTMRVTGVRAGAATDVTAESATLTPGTRVVGRWDVDAAFRERVLSAAVILIVLLPLVVSAFALLGAAGSEYHPSADQAVIELNVRNVFHVPPLLGPYSRFGWFHPGPALYYALALPYWLTGGSSASLAFAALFLNALALVGILLIARRRGGLAVLMPTALIVEILVLRLGTQYMRDVWNPDITVFPFLLLAFLAWTMSCGERWALPVSAFVASFLVQTHVGYALPVAALIAFGIGGLVWSTRQSQHAVEAVPASDAAPRSTASPRRGWLMAVSVTVVIVLVMWLPPLIQQLTGEPGNFTKLLDFFTQHGQEHSTTQAWHVLSAQFGAWPDWLSGHTSFRLLGVFGASASAPFPVVLVLLGAAAVVALRGLPRESLHAGSEASSQRTPAIQRSDSVRLDLLVGLLVVASFVAVTRIVGEVWDYIVKWLWAVGALAWIAIIVSVISVIGERAHPKAPESERRDTLRRAGRASLALGLAALLLLGVIGAGTAATAGTPDATSSRRIAQFADAVERALATAPGRGVVEIRMSDASGPFGGAGSVWTGAGVADLLAHRGVDVRVARDLGYVYGDDRVVDSGERVRLVVLPVDAPDLDKVRAVGSWRQIARRGNMHIFVQPG